MITTSDLQHLKHGAIVLEDQHPLPARIEIHV
jgi:hypothetical protein